MRIAFLVPDVTDVDGTTRSAITQANSHAGRHDVRIVSVLRGDGEPHYEIDGRVRVDHLVDLVPDPAADGGDLDEGAARLHARESALVPARWDDRYSALTDAALEANLPGLKADVLVTVTPALLATAVQLAPPRVVLVHQEHRSSADRGPRLDCLLTYAPQTDVLSVPTRATEEWLREELGGAAPEIVVLPHPLPVGHTPRSRLDSKLIVAAGRVVGEKQFGKLVLAFAEIADQIPDWRLRVLGDGPHLNELRRRARKNQLWDRVEAPGRSADMATEWARASISALTSRSEGLPMVVQEAMAAGVPVAAFDCAAGPRELIEHEVNGLLVAPDSVSGMAAALLRLATDDDLRARLGEEAFRSAQQYAPRLLADRWERVFRSALDRRQAVAGGRLAVRAAESEGLAGERAGGSAEVTSNPQAPDGTTPAQARRTALEWAARIADRVSDAWFVIPPHAATGPIVVLPMPDRDGFLQVLEQGAGPSWLSLVDTAGSGWPERRGNPADLAHELRRARTPRISLEPWPMTGDRRGVLAEGGRVDVEFWEVAPGGDLVAPGPNPFAGRVPADSETVDHEIEGVRVRTLPLMTEPTVDECRFPVDVVYTWVDGDDPAWNAAREERLARLAGSARRREISGLARFTSRDELRYSMRSLHLFAPWIRLIHLVTAGQVPDWLDTGHPAIRLVDHSKILADDALPTFNSRAIETALHHVPDLTEHWLYFNDDVFLGRPVPPEVFFTPAGQSSVFLSSHSLGLTGLPDSPPYLQAAWNNRRLLREMFGVVSTHTLAHTPHPQRRSVLAEIEQRSGDAIARTARSPFRSDTDVSLLSSLAQHYGLVTGSAVAREPNNAFINLDRADLRFQLGRILDRRNDFICVGDAPDHALPENAIRSILGEFLESYFPVPAPWERSLARRRG